MTTRDLQVTTEYPTNQFEEFVMLAYIVEQCASFTVLAFAPQEDYEALGVPARASNYFSFGLNPKKGDILKIANDTGGGWEPVLIRAPYWRARTFETMAIEAEAFPVEIFELLS